jgi:hypothetical protein
MNADPRPVVHCFAAHVLDDGRTWGNVLRVSLETASWLRAIGYVIVGPDPHDMIALAKWERDQPLRGMPS